MLDKNEKILLTWKNISAWIKPSKSSTEIKLLQNVSGVANSGSLVAVLSPSGGGKTTLLATLNKRFKGTVEGQILLNGQEISEKHMSIISGYVPQKHFLFNALTVMEHLRFMASLRMGYGVTIDECTKTILKVVEDLGLSHVLQSKIFGLSGGEQKRLGLAVKLLTKPKILFCDEPTTGLDSFGAANVISILHKLALNGRIVICSIHQPASGTLQMFHFVSLLTSNGSLAYHGPVESVIEYFQSVGLRCPVSYDISEFLVSQVTWQDEETKIKATTLVDSFQNSKLYEELMNTLEQTPVTNFTMEQWTSSHTKEIVPVGNGVELSWLMWRECVLTLRTYRSYLLTFTSYLFVMALIAVSYGYIKIDQTGIGNVQGLFNIMIYEVAYCSIYYVINAFPQDMSIFLYEVADKTYSTHSYYISKVVVQLPKLVVQAFIYSYVGFSLPGLIVNFQAFMSLSVPLFYISVVSSAYGYFLSTAFDNINKACLFAVPFELVTGAFMGLMVMLRSLPWYTSWMRYISFFYYGYKCLTVGQWANFGIIPCDAGSNVGCHLSGLSVIRKYDFDTESLALDYVLFTLQIFIYHLLGYLFLFNRTKQAAMY